MRTGAIFGTLLIVAVVLGGFLTADSRPAHAVTYEAQCTADGGKLEWDGVGLRWCCKKRVKFSRTRKIILWCKS